MMMPCRSLAFLLLIPVALAGCSHAAVEEVATESAVEVETSQQNDRALLALLDGDPTEAGRRFDAALKPLGLDLADFDAAVAYRLIQYRALVRAHGGK